MRHLHRAFIAAFFALCLLPGLAMLAHWQPGHAVDEQRRLASRPDPIRPATILHDANAWFSDHFGLRAWFIQIETELTVRLFGLTDRVYVGRDGYLFYRDLLDDTRPLVDALIARHGDRIRTNMERYAAALHEAGIGMTLTMIPIGDRMMPEELPPFIAIRPALPHYQPFEAALLGLHGIDVVDSGAILRATMQQRPVFQRTDFHWNEPGAFPVMQRIAKGIAKGEGRDPVWRHDLQIGHERFSGGVARFMPVFHPPSEDTLTVVQNWAWPPGFQLRNAVGDLQWVSTVTPPRPDLLPPVFVIGDSYMNALLPTGFPAYFNAVYRKGWQLHTTLAEVTAAIPPDTSWLVMEFIDIGKQPLTVFADDADVNRAVAIIASLPQKRASTLR